MAELVGGKAHTAKPRLFKVGFNYMLNGFGAYPPVVSADKKGVSVGCDNALVGSYRKVRLNGRQTGIVKINRPFLIALTGYGHNSVTRNIRKVKPAKLRKTQTAV